MKNSLKLLNHVVGNPSLMSRIKSDFDKVSKEFELSNHKSEILKLQLDLPSNVEYNPTTDDTYEGMKSYNKSVPV